MQTHFWRGIARLKLRGIRSLLLAIGLCSCSAESAAPDAEDPAPDYRYRLTVEVDTPKGVKTGSSVIAVEQAQVRPGSNPASIGLDRRVRGEAVAVDLPGGQTLFALLRSDNNVDWASYVFVYLAVDQSAENAADIARKVLEVEGVRTLPRMWPPVAHLDERSAYPMFVTFTDLADPTSVARVDPDDLTASFGGPTSLRRITVQLTEDPVTSGIEERLKWLVATQGTLLHRPREIPIGDLPIEYQIGKTSFKRGDWQ
jgi:hypothetical protein